MDTNDRYDLKIFITNVCNQACSYCFERDTMKTLSRRIDESVRKDIVKFIQTDINSMYSINFLGGETFLNIDDMTWILDKLYDLLEETQIEICFFTNGITFNSYVTNFYQRFKKLNLMVHITDHNCILSNSDSILINHFNYLKQNDIRFDIRTLFDLHKIKNIQSLNEYYNYISSFADVTLFPAYYDKNNEVTKLDLDNLISWCKNNAQIMNTKLIDELLLHIFRAGRFIDPIGAHDTCDHCGAGVKELVITTNGSLMGCETFMGASDLEELNIKDVHSIKEARLKSDQFKYLYDRYDKEPQKCSDCRYRILCTNCRYNFSTNSDVYSEKVQAVCDFTAMIYYCGLELLPILYMELHRREYRTRLELLSEIKDLMSEVIEHE